MYELPMVLEAAQKECPGKVGGAGCDQTCHSIYVPSQEVAIPMVPRYFYRGSLLVQLFWLSKWLKWKAQMLHWEGSDFLVLFWSGASCHWNCLGPPAIRGNLDGLPQRTALRPVQMDHMIAANMLLNITSCCSLQIYSKDLNNAK